MQNNLGPTLRLGAGSGDTPTWIVALTLMGPLWVMPHLRWKLRKQNVRGERPTFVSKALTILSFSLCTCRMFDEIRGH